MIRRGYRKARRRNEVRLAELERQMSHLEDVTGCQTDEDLPDVDEPTIREALAAQRRIIKHLLISLDAIGPKFSIDGFREALAPVDASLTARGDVEPELDDSHRLLRMMERLIPDPLPRQRPQADKPGRFRPKLVPKEPERDT